MFPLVFTGVLGRFDMRCSVAGGGHSSQAGALRLALSRALLSFLSQGQVENMRQGEHFLYQGQVENMRPGDHFLYQGQVENMRQGVSFYLRIEVL